MNGHSAIANRAFTRSGAGPVTLSAWNAVILPLGVLRIDEGEEDEGEACARTVSALW